MTNRTTGTGFSNRTTGTGWRILWTDANKWDKTVKTDLIDDGLGMNVNVHVTKHSFVVSLLLLLNNINVHLSCVYQHPERSHDTY